MAVHRAYFREGSLTIAVSPSGRQTGEFLRKAKGFARKLGVKARGDGDNEITCGKVQRRGGCHAAVAGEATASVARDLLEAAIGTDPEDLIVGSALASSNWQ